MTRSALFTAACGLALLAGAQNLSAQSYSDGIQVEGLEDAQAYDSGAISAEQGALPPDLWSGTSVDVATQVTQNAPVNSRSSVVRDMVARVMLSPGAPPSGAERGQDWTGTRLNKIIDIGRDDAVEDIFRREPRLADSDMGDRIRADSALRQRNFDAACRAADNVIEARAEPYWAKLRAFCHVLRDEIPAAELTADVLSRSGHSDPAFFAALRSATGIRTRIPADAPRSVLVDAMLDSGEADDGERSLGGFVAGIGDMSPAAREDYLKSLAKPETPEEAAPDDGLAGGLEGEGAPQVPEPVFGTFDIEYYLEDDSASGWGRLFGVLSSSSDASIIARSGAELLSRAQSRGIFTPMAHMIAPYAGAVPASLRAQYSPELWAKMAVEQGDLSALRTLYDYVPSDDPLRSRLALSSDALGNGFIMGAIGQDMTARFMSGDDPRAVRDVYIAVALGARLSEPVMLELTERSSSTARRVSPGDMLALEHASDKGSKAETALRAANIIGSDGTRSLDDETLYRVIRALYGVGFYEFAGRVAAEDFLLGQ